MRKIQTENGGTRYAFCSEFRTGLTEGKMKRLLALFLLAGVAFAAGHIGLGDSGTIDNGVSVVMLSTTKDGYDDINKGLAARDKVGLVNLIRTGRAFTVKRGTRAKVIDVTFAMRRVRIMDGEKVNAAGWLPFEYLK